LGIDQVFAQVRPEEQGAKVAELQARGHRVAMVGDGVNDAPALARADVGLAIGAGTDVAIASAGVILAGDDPRSVLSVIELSRAGYRKMRQNLWWAAGYNLVAVPLAAGVLAPVGFVMPMAVGAVLMSLSTVVVALNAQVLRRLDLRPEASTKAVLRRARTVEGTGAPRPVRTYDLVLVKPFPRPVGKRGRPRGSGGAGGGFARYEPTRRRRRRFPCRTGPCRSHE